MKKLSYFESLRGIAALVVVFGHFVVGFYPAMYFGSAGRVHTESGIEVFISGTPLNLLYNGTFSVSIFFVLSGFVLTYKFFKDRSNQVYLLPLAVKRYVRLLLPVLFSILITYLYLKLIYFYIQMSGESATSSWLAGYSKLEPRFGTALYEAFIEAFFKRHSSYNGVLWTMTIEFYGSILVFLFVVLFGNWRFRYFAYIAAIAVCGHGHYTAFVFGMLLCDLFTRWPELFGSRKYAAMYVLLMMIGLFLGSYPAGRTVEGTMYAFMQPFASARMYHMLGATLIMLSLLSMPRLQSILSMKGFVFLGKISFSQYILHALIISSVGGFIFNMLTPFFSYHQAFLAMVSITMPIIVLGSTLTYRFVDAPGVRISQIVYERAVRLGKYFGNLPLKFVPNSITSHPFYRSLFPYESNAEIPIEDINASP